MKEIQSSTNRCVESASFLSKELCKSGTIIADEGNLVEALEKYNLAIDTDPNNQIALFNRATVKIDLGDIEGARNDFKIFDKLKNEASIINYKYPTTYVKTYIKKYSWK